MGKALVCGAPWDASHRCRKSVCFLWNSSRRAHTDFAYFILFCWCLLSSSDPHFFGHQGTRFLPLSTRLLSVHHPDVCFNLLCKYTRAELALASDGIYATVTMRTQTPVECLVYSMSNDSLGIGTPDVVTHNPSPFALTSP